MSATEVVKPEAWEADLADPVPEVVVDSGWFRIRVMSPGDGKTKASSGSLTRERSTDLSAIPATNRSCRSRTSLSIPTSVAPMVMVRMPRTVLGSLILKPCFLVGSTARTIEMVLASKFTSVHRRARSSFGLAPVNAAVAMKGYPGP
jgi:hypothetical protein